MFSSMGSLTILTVLFVAILISCLSGLLLLNPRVPTTFVRTHINLVSLPPLVALIGILTFDTNETIGPLFLDPLAWLMVLFVLTLGLVIQRFCMRYLLGDRFYRKYFVLFTFMTATASVAWLSDDLRLMLVCWGATLLALTLIIGLNKEWKVVKNAASLTGRLFLLSWIALVVGVIWLTQATGHSSLSLVMSETSLAQLGSWERTGINLLVVLSVIIPAAQWPFHRWLLDSVVAPTPVSAIMHAGIVNVGGILLTRFAPLFHGDISQIFLIVLSSISVLIGAGIILVQADYKRQLVGSTIAQMGFMLIQCALGAYLAAIIHIVLHGLFKATLFLQAGMAANRVESVSRNSQSSPVLWVIVGGGVSVASAIGFWLASPDIAYQYISALLLGWALLVSWVQLVAFGKGITGRFAGFFLVGVVASVYIVIHAVFDGWLHDTIYQGAQPSILMVIFVLFVIVLGSLIGTMATGKNSSASFPTLY